MKRKREVHDLFFSRTWEFLEVYLPKQSGKSSHTIKAYRDSLTVFRRYVCDVRGMGMAKFSYADCTYEFMLEYSRYLQESCRHKPSTVNQRLSALKAYLGYCSDCDVSLTQIAIWASRLPFVDVPKLQKPVISDECLAAMINAPKDTRIGRRDKLILIMLFDTAVRVNELLEILVSDMSLNSETPFIQIKGKGNKERIVSVTDDTAAHIERYLREFHNGERALNKPLFYTTMKGVSSRMSESNVERIVRKYADIVRKDHPELPNPVYPHMFRRTRATGLYQDGVSLDMISRTLGHNSTKTTRIYAAPSMEMLHEAMDTNIIGKAPKEKLWRGSNEEIARMCGLR